MKKTIIALLALGGVAAAADTSVLEEAYIGFTDFSSGKAALGTMKDSITLSTEGNITTLSGVTFDTSSDTAGADGFSITLVVNLAEMKNVESFTPIATGSAVRNGSTYTIGMGLTADRKLNGYWGSGAYDDGPTSDVLGSEGSVTLTYTLGAHDDSSGSWIYVGDNETSYYATGLSTSYSTFDTIKIDNLGGAVEQVYVHNRVLSTAEVGTLMGEIASIPEPTTATLSLLALAGLAARRRRK